MDQENEFAPSAGLATFIAAVGYLIVALPGGLPILCTGLVLAGIGSSTQHPRASLLVTNAYGNAARGPLGIYNFAGDLGKAILPAAVALLLSVLAWRSVVALIAVLGSAVALILLLIVPRQSAIESAVEKRLPEKSQGGKGFRLLLAIGALDTALRMGYLLIPPLLIHAKGGTEKTVGVGLALLFIGGALGKAVCGWLGEHLGVVWSVVATEAATALFMMATLALPLRAMLSVLPLLGIALNGTSSVLDGTVPELAPRGDTGRAFAMFYTGIIVTGGFAPIVYGILADQTSRAVGISASALTAAVIIPLVLSLRSARWPKPIHFPAQSPERRPRAIRDPTQLAEVRQFDCPLRPDAGQAVLIPLAHWELCPGNFAPGTLPWELCPLPRSGFRSTPIRIEMFG